MVSYWLYIKQVISTYKIHISLLRIFDHASQTKVVPNFDQKFARNRLTDFDVAWRHFLYNMYSQVISALRALSGARQEIL